MPFRSKRVVATCFAIGLASATMTFATTARADHTTDSRMTDDTAYTLPKGKHRIGLLDLDWGARDDIMLSSYHPYFTIAFVNGGAKWRPYQGEHFAIALRAHAFYLSSAVVETVIEGANFDIVVVPAEVIASVRFNDTFTASAGGVMTGVHVEGSFDQNDFQGAAAVTNLQTHATIEARLNQRTALVLHGRYMVFQTTNAKARVTLRPDDFTTIEAGAAGTTDALDFPNVFSVLPAVHFSWPMFNLRVGLGYGSLNIPGVNIMLPARIPLPELDMYWVF